MQRRTWKLAQPHYQIREEQFRSAHRPEDRIFNQVQAKINRLFSKLLIEECLLHAQFVDGRTQQFQHLQVQCCQ